MPLNRSTKQPVRDLLILTGDFRHCPGKAQSVVWYEGDLHLVCRFEDGPAEFLGALPETLRCPPVNAAEPSHSFVPPHFFKKLSGAGLEFIGFLLTVALIMVTLGILDIFGNALHNAAVMLIGYLNDAGNAVHVLDVEGDLFELGVTPGSFFVEAYKELLLLVLSMGILTLGVLAVFFGNSPLLEDDVGSVGQRVRRALQDILKSRPQLRRRLRGRLIQAAGNQPLKLHVWNIDPLGESCALLLDVGRRLEYLELILHVRQDEVTSALQHFRERLGEDQVSALAGASSGETPGTANALSLLQEAERALLPFLNLAGFPERGLQADTPIDASTTVLFSEACFNHWLGILATDADPLISGRFLQRCREDYGLLVPVDAGGRHAGFALAGILSDMRSTAVNQAYPQLLVSFQYQLLHGRHSRLIDDALFQDPLACLVLMHALRVLLDQQTLTPSVRYGVSGMLAGIFSAWVRAVEKTERVELLQYVFPAGQQMELPLAGYFPKVVDFGACADVTPHTIQADVAARTCWGALDSRTLRSLALLLETKGEYERASHIWDVLSPLMPLLAEVKRARLAERLGHDAEALDRIDHAARMLKQSGEGSGMAIAADTHLELAWIIYSTATESRYKAGKAALKKAAHCLSCLDPGLPKTAMAFWRYHNYTALYLDRDRDFAGAIEAHRTALAIPGSKENG